MSYYPPYPPDGPPGAHQLHPSYPAYGGEAPPPIPLDQRPVSYGGQPGTHGFQQPPPKQYYQAPPYPPQPHPYDQRALDQYQHPQHLQPSHQHNRQPSHSPDPHPRHQQHPPAVPPQQITHPYEDSKQFVSPNVAQRQGYHPPGGYQEGQRGQRFKYSSCSGRRKALLVGINYYGQKNQLSGCINDVKAVLSFLMRNRYERNNIVVLTDDARDPKAQPTKQNILQAMHWLVKDARENDSLFFHFSGHGGQTRDLDGDEDDGMDEVIYPVDHQRAGHIVDDDIHRILVASLSAGVRLTAIFDSCHSGSCMDLPYVYSTKGVIKEPNMLKDVGAGAVDALMAYVRKDTIGMAKGLFNMGKRVVRGDDAYKKTLETKSSPADVIMFSGSKDEQTSADAKINNQATGAMSWAFMQAVQTPNQTYLQLLNRIRDILDSKNFHQKPQLSASHPIHSPHCVPMTGHPDPTVVDRLRASHGDGRVHILVGCSGSVATIKLPLILHALATADTSSSDLTGGGDTRNDLANINVGDGDDVVAANGRDKQQHKMTPPPVSIRVVLTTAAVEFLRLPIRALVGSADGLDEGIVGVDGSSVKDTDRAAFHDGDNDKVDAQGPAQDISALEYIRRMPNVDSVYIDADEWAKPWQRGDAILHIELRKWADIFVIAPLSLNTLAKITNGICDNLLTSVVRAWDADGTADGKGIRRIVVAPAGNASMWKHPVTRKQLYTLEEEWGGPNGWFDVLRPEEGALACGDVGMGKMYAWYDIVRYIKDKLR